MTDWLALVPVYHSIAEIDKDMRAALQDLSVAPECDMVLAGLAAYLANSYPEPLKEHILSIIDLYCGKPVSA